MILNPDVRNLLQLFEQHDIRYMITGAYALASYGIVRGTSDIDIWVDSTQENAMRIIEALEAFGVAIGELQIKDFTEGIFLFRMGLAPNQIEIINYQDGVEFGLCWKPRTLIECDGLAIPFVDIHDYITNKRASGRLKDLADLERLSIAYRNNKLPMLEFDPLGD